MYKTIKPTKGSLKANKAYVGQSMEIMVQRILNNNEPINAQSIPIYQHRGDGVNPDYNIRTDRWEYAIEASDKMTQSQRATRQAGIDAWKEKINPSKKDIGGPESTQGTKE